MELEPGDDGVYARDPVGQLLYWFDVAGSSGSEEIRQMQGEYDQWVIAAQRIYARDTRIALGFRAIEDVSGARFGWERVDITAPLDLRKASLTLPNWIPPTGVLGPLTYRIPAFRLAYEVLVLIARLLTDLPTLGDPGPALEERRQAVTRAYSVSLSQQVFVRVSGSGTAAPLSDRRPSWGNDYEIPIDWLSPDELKGFSAALGQLERAVLDARVAEDAYHRAHMAEI